VLHRVLSESDFLVQVAGSAEEADERVRQDSPDVVLLDLRLPGMSGDEWLRGFRGTNSSSVVLVISGYVDSQRGAELLYAGADDIIAKPFNVEELSARLCTVFRGHRAGGDCIVLDGGVVLDPSTRRVSVGTTVVRVTATEFGIVWNLVSCPGNTFGKSF
jgi:DNA-binding response OmpR family regulator